LAAGFFLFGIIRFAAGSFVVAIAEWGITGLLGINLLIIVRRRFLIASYVSLFLFVMAAFALYAMQPVKEMNDIYIFSTYIISVVCVTPLLSYRLTPDYYCCCHRSCWANGFLYYPVFTFDDPNRRK